MDNIDPENLPQFHVPQKFLKKFFDFTGNSEGGRGYIVAFVDQSGRPMVHTMAESQIIEMGLRKALETYLEALEDSEERFES